MVTRVACHEECIGFARTMQVLFIGRREEIVFLYDHNTENDLCSKAWLVLKESISVLSRALAIYWESFNGQRFGSAIPRSSNYGIGAATRKKPSSGTIDCWISKVINDFLGISKLTKVSAF